MEKKGEMKLLDFWASPFGMRARMALALKGVEYEYIEQDLRNKSDLLLRSNPVHKKIPVLIHNGIPICESLNIVTYLDEAFSAGDSPALLPADPIARANARFWADFVDKKLFDCGREMCKAKGEKEAAAAREGFVEAARLLEAEIGEKEFFGGAGFGFLDVALAPIACSWFPAFEDHCVATGGIRIEEHCPGIVAWAARCWKVEAIAKSLQDPKKISEFVVVLKSRLAAIAAAATAAAAAE